MYYVFSNNEAILPQLHLPSRYFLRVKISFVFKYGNKTTSALSLVVGKLPRPELGGKELVDLF